MNPRECTMADGDTIAEILAKEPCVCRSCVEYQEWANDSMDRQDAKKLDIEIRDRFKEEKQSNGEGTFLW